MIRILHHNWEKDLHGKPLLPEDGTINSMEGSSVIGNELLKMNLYQIKY